jgi:anti-sigma factor RsiW
MTCSEFNDRFSDYYDGTGDPAFLGAADAHLADCAECRRYHAVVVQGSAVLRSAPALAVPEDFLGRLQHRIYHVDDASAISREAGSATTVPAAVAIAALIALAAWSPALIRAPRVELPPIVVSRPEPRPVGVRPPQFWISPGASSFVSAVERGLWDDPELFTRYSPLMAPSVQRVTLVRRADLE